MDSFRNGGLKKIIDSACVIRLNTGEIQELSTNGDSCCHFFEPVNIEDYKITFRLDLSDLDKDGNPTLDADFYDYKTNKILPNLGERYKAHHTNTINHNTRVYEWEFNEVKLTFKVMVRWLAEIEEKAITSTKVICEVNRNGTWIDE